MARKNPVPTIEKEIGARLREFRESLKIEQGKFALSLQIDGRSLGAYENGRVPLPYYVALRVCERFQANPAWLADGMVPMKAAFQPKLMKQASIPAKILFSQAYREFLQQPLQASMDLWALLKTAALRLEPEGVFMKCFEGTDNELILADRLVSRFVEEHISSTNGVERAIFVYELIELLVSKQKALGGSKRSRGSK